MKNILTIALCFVGISSFAQKEINVDDAKNHEGDSVKICTKIYGGRYFERDSLTLLNAGGIYPDAPLTVVIRAAARKEFNKPEEDFKGEAVCISGKIEMYKGKPEIEITSKDQITGQPESK